MIFTPGQTVTVLDTTHKPAGDGIVQGFNPETQRCDVLFQYPGKAKPESIPVPTYRLIPQASDNFVH